EKRGGSGIRIDVLRRDHVEIRHSGGGASQGVVDANGQRAFTRRTVILEWEDGGIIAYAINDRAGENRQRAVGKGKVDERLVVGIDSAAIPGDLVVDDGTIVRSALSPAGVSA